jgi:hypothetical protein
MEWWYELSHCSPLGNVEEARVLLELIKTSNMEGDWIYEWPSEEEVPTRMAYRGSGPLPDMDTECFSPLSRLLQGGEHMIWFVMADPAVVDGGCGMAIVSAGEIRYSDARAIRQLYGEAYAIRQQQKLLDSSNSTP